MAKKGAAKKKKAAKKKGPKKLPAGFKTKKECADAGAFRPE